MISRYLKSITIKKIVREVEWHNWRRSFGSQHRAAWYICANVSENILPLCARSHDVTDRKLQSHSAEDLKYY